jgi:hypothetical protein
MTCLISAVLEAFDKWITWHMPGHSPLSADYNGHDEVIGFFKHTLALCGGIFAIEDHHVLAEEDVSRAGYAERNPGSRKKLSKW